MRSLPRPAFGFPPLPPHIRLNSAIFSLHVIDATVKFRHFRRILLNFIAPRFQDGRSDSIETCSGSYVTRRSGHIGFHSVLARLVAVQEIRFFKFLEDSLGIRAGTEILVIFQGVLLKQIDQFVFDSFEVSD